MICNEISDDVCTILRFKQKRTHARQLTNINPSFPSNDAERCSYPINQPIAHDIDDDIPTKLLSLHITNQAKHSSSLSFPPTFFLQLPAANHPTTYLGNLPSRLTSMSEAQHIAPDTIDNPTTHS